MNKAQQLPQRKSIRLKDYDYSQAGYYAVTICVHQRKWMFGRVEQEEMQLNIIGRTAQYFWNHLPERYPGLELDAFIFMPNHMHGIVVLPSFDATHAQWDIPLDKIIKAYKALTSRWIHAGGFAQFGWQDRYFDTVLRNERQLRAAQAYIQNNPLRWSQKQDAYYTLDHQQYV